MVMTMSASRAASAGFCAPTAPSVTTSATAASVRSKARTACPAFSRLRTISRPIVPMPMKPTLPLPSRPICLLVFLLAYLQSARCFAAFLLADDGASSVFIADLKLLAQRRIRPLWIARDDRLEDAPVVVDQVRLHRGEGLHEFAAASMRARQKARHRI